MSRLWAFVKSAPWTFGIGALVFALALGGVLYGVIARPGDLTFLVRDGHELRWDRGDLPVTCFHAKDLPAEYLSAYDGARAEIRERVGAELLSKCLPWALQTPPDGPASGLLYLRTRPPRDGLEGAHGAQTEHRYDKRSGRILGAVLAADLDLPAELLPRVYLHEAGHVLGLDHDRESSSVMFPTAAGRPKALSKRDVGALRSAYVSGD